MTTYFDKTIVWRNTTMALNLAKNASIDLTKSLPGVVKFAIGLSWDANSDLDASALKLTAQGKIKNPDEENVAYYRNATNNPYGEKQNPVKGITHSGDARDGSASGDDETITIDGSQLIDGDVVMIAITSYSDGEPNVFGNAANPVAKLYDADGKVLVEVKLNEDAAFSTAVEFVELRKENGSLVFKNLTNSVGNCSANGLADIIAAHS